jgi:hypothetical protein
MSVNFPTLSTEPLTFLPAGSWRLLFLRVNQHDVGSVTDKLEELVVPSDKICGHVIRSYR